MTHRLLLIGAGFSRNWGGWLASELNDYLPTSLFVKRDRHLQQVLQRNADGGFEAALQDVRNAYVKSPTPESLTHLQNIQGAIAEAFEAMDIAFSKIPSLDLNQNLMLKVARFLGRFDAIFSLNQDLLLERHYPQDDVGFQSPQQWHGWYRPGIRALENRNTGPFRDIGKMRWTPHDRLEVQVGAQPVFKLHGSSDWWSTTGEPMLIMGGAKVMDIQRHPLLNWYQEHFEAYLRTPNAALMVIGYGFADDHINASIRYAWEQTQSLSLFVVNPVGRKTVPASLVEVINCGTSSRPLAETFGGDQAEHAKLMRFFEV